MIDPEILLKVQKRVKQYKNGELIPDKESLRISGAAKIMLYDLEKDMREFEFADEGSDDYEQMVKNLHERIKSAYKLGVIRESNSKDDIIKELQEKLSKKDGEIEGLNKQIIDARSEADLWRGKYEGKKEKDSTPDDKKRFRGSVESK